MVDFYPNSCLYECNWNDRTLLDYRSTLEVTWKSLRILCNLFTSKFPINDKNPAINLVIIVELFETLNRFRIRGNSINIIFEKLRCQPFRNMSENTVSMQQRKHHDTAVFLRLINLDNRHVARESFRHTVS